MSFKIVEVPIGSAKANPYRNLKDYPFVEAKIEALMASYRDVGMWPGGIIARVSGNGYEIAFGHHRVEAAKRSKLKTVTLTVGKLTDEQMIGYMGRENLEDYNADFLCMLEAWQAAKAFKERNSGRDRAPNLQAIDIASLLGWVRIKNAQGDLRANETASACHSADLLMVAGLVSRDDLRGLAVYAVKEICTRAQARLEQMQRIAEERKLPQREVAATAKQIGKAVVKTAQEVRSGALPQREIRGQVDVNAYRFAKESKQQSPLFEAFGKAMVAQIDRMLKGDSVDEKLNEIAGQLGAIEMEEDKAILRRIHFALGELSERAEKAQNKVIPTKDKVTFLRLAEKGQ